MDLSRDSEAIQLLRDQLEQLQAEQRTTQEGLSELTQTLCTLLKAQPQASDHEGNFESLRQQLENVARQCNRLERQTNPEPMSQDIKALGSQIDSLRHKLAVLDRNMTKALSYDWMVMALVGSGASIMSALLVIVLLQWFPPALNKDLASAMGQIWRQTDWTNTNLV